MNRDVQLETCSYCGGALTVVRPTTPPHFAALWCPICNRHRGWLQTPDNELGRNYIMAIGKYKGRTLDQIAAIDRGYLCWAAQNFNGERIRKSVRRYLATRPASRIREGEPVLTG